MMKNYFRITIPFEWPNYWRNFLYHCLTISEVNKCNDIIIVINYELKPHGKFIVTKTQGSYLRWDDPKYHTLFLLRWS